MRFRLFASMVLVANALIGAGCSTSGAARSQPAPDQVELTRFWQPHLLYLLASPHARLHVEVDAVEGCAPRDATLDQLRSFLAAQCQKPRGIEIGRNDVIPIKAAHGLSPQALARAYLNGPPQGAGDTAPAFMYVLFYDGALCGQTAEKHARPHVRFLPYPAIIFFNTRYEASSAANQVLLHEAGHLLGLSRRPVHASDYHCHDRNCLMNEGISVSMPRRLLGLESVKQKQLCRRCESELSESVNQPPPSNLRFVGPVMVRSEAGYHVLSLADQVGLIVGDLVEQDCRDFAALARAQTSSPNERGKWRPVWLVRKDVRADPAKLRDIINRAKSDPYERVRIIASALERAMSRTIGDARVSSEAHIWEPH